MIELQLGFISTQDLADWAGLSPDYLAKNKKAWCAKNLIKYAEYENVRGGVRIAAIKFPIYASSGYKEAEEKFHSNKYWGHDDTMADSITNCARKMYPDMKAKIKLSTLVSYDSKIKCGSYGTCFGKNRRTGPLGSCKYVFGKIIDNEFYFFEDEENEIRKQLSKMYLTDEGRIMRQQAAKEAWMRNEISEEDYIFELRDSVENDKNWIDFKFALEEKLGCEVGFRQLLEPAGWAKNYNVRTGSFDF